MDKSRRSVLKLFGIAAAAVPAAKIAAAEDVAAGPDIPPLQNPMAPDLLKPPEGMTYNWKRIFLTAEEPDLENILQMVAHGWKPVPYGRHAHQVALVPGGTYWIEHGGLVLMEKPTKDIPAPKAYPTPWEHKEVRGWDS